MHPKLEQWLGLLFEIRVGKQVVVVRGSREHPDIRTLRTHTKQFEIWQFSRSLVLFPEGYKLVPAEEFNGVDGTIPDLSKAEEISQRELSKVIREWLKLHKDSHIFFLHDGDDFWKLTCQMADAQSTADLSGQQLKAIFKLDTGEKEEQTEEYPRRLRDFLDNLSSEEEKKVIDFLASGALK